MAIKAAVKQTKQVVKEKVLPVVKKAAQATKKPTNSSSTKAKTASVDKNRITSEAELKALLDEHRKTRVIGSDGEPITTLADKRKVLSAESTVTPDGLYPYVMLGSKMSYALFIEDYLKVSDANAPIKENFEAAVSLINPVRKVKKGEEVLENVRNWEKVIEETYGLANNSQKAKDAKTTQKEIDQLGEYVKKLDKGTGELKHPVLDNPRVGSALKDDFYHNFNDIIDNYAVDAQRFDLPNKKGHMDSLYQIEGSMDKYETKYVKVKNNAPEMLQTKETIDGVFEWVVDPTTNTVTHRTFIPGGKVSGKINQWGK
ncbi:hypothetical protein ACQQ6W_14215 [Lysinibacillus fusiformis]